MLNIDFFSPSSHRIESIPSQLEKWAEEVRRQTLKSSRLQFLPVSVAQTADDHDRTVLSGYQPTTGSANNPIIVRGQALPELTATPQWFPHENKWRVSFRPSAYGHKLSPGQQKKKLVEWFEEQLIWATSDTLLIQAKNRLLRQTQQHLANFLKDQQDYCRQIEETMQNLPTNYL